MIICPTSVIITNNRIYNKLLLNFKHYKGIILRKKPSRLFYELTDRKDKIEISLSEYPNIQSYLLDEYRGVYVDRHLIGVYKKGDNLPKKLISFSQLESQE